VANYQFSVHRVRRQVKRDSLSGLLFISERRKI